jgi:hypothetical protein
MIHWNQILIRNPKQKHNGMLMIKKNTSFLLKNIVSNKRLIIYTGKMCGMIKAVIALTALIGGCFNKIIMRPVMIIQKLQKYTESISLCLLSLF